jgi:RND family efflux transporter MFP subunit
MPDQSVMRLVLPIVLALAACAIAQSTDGPWRPSDLQGVVNPSKQVTLTAPLDGVLSDLLVEEGQDVAADEPIARMDDGLQKAAVELATLRAEGAAEIRKAKLALEEAEILVERYTEAFNQDAASEWEVRRTKLQRDQAQAQLDALGEEQAMAKSNLNLELERLKRFTINAPFAGRVVRKAVEPGATLARSDAVAILVALDPLEAQLHLPAELYGKLSVGDSLRLAASTPIDRELTAKVKTIDAIIDPASRTFRCVLTIENPGSKMPAGFTAVLIWPQP